MNQLRPIRAVAILEAYTVTGPAKNVIRFAQLARVPAVYLPPSSFRLLLSIGQALDKPRLIHRTSSLRLRAPPGLKWTINITAQSRDLTRTTDIELAAEAIPTLSLAPAEIVSGISSSRNPCIG